MPETVSTPDGSPLSEGFIDIHSHLLPGVDDGCANLREALECVQRLAAAGFVGSICTPHINPDIYPTNLPVHIQAWTMQLQRQLDEQGLSYRLWSGGELRLTKNSVNWLKQHGPPTLADSRCVLVDFWEEKWPVWITGCFEWLLTNGYQPLLAHPERIAVGHNLDNNLRACEKMGVWLQGNFQCMTGQEGAQASHLVRQLLTEGRYHFLALDMHGPDTLQNRLDGLRLVETEFGVETLRRLADAAVRQWIVKAGPKC